MQAILNKSIFNMLIASIIFLLITFLYKYFTRNFDYWKKQNVPFSTPWPVFGNCFDVFTLRKSIASFLADLYHQHKSPYFGIFVFNEPHIVVKDLGLIKHVLVKDFNYFYDRAVTLDEKCDSLTSKMLFFVKNPEWKFIRTRMSPVFTSGKLKSMVTFVNKCAEDMKSHLSQQLNHGSVEITEVCLKFATNVVASCAFGLNANSFDENNPQFRMVGKKIFELRWKPALRNICYNLIPNIAKLFKMPFIDPSVTNFLRCIFWRTLEDRENKNQKRNDLIDIINQIRKENRTHDNIKFEGDTVVAQAAQFFAAGFETIGSTIAFALYELCLAPNIQNKLRLEIEETVSEYGKISYETLQNMKYLDMVILETLRKYPSAPFLNRKCMKDYKIPNSDIILKKGSFVFISLFGLHYDDKYFPDPEIFSPERFSAENRWKIPKCSYLPFGDGPRNCIGERFALLVTKLGLVHIILEFFAEKSYNLSIPIQFSSLGMVLVPKNGIHLNLKKI